MVCFDISGPDSTPNDGIYTGMFSANQMAGDGYYSIRVSCEFNCNVIGTAVVMNSNAIG